MKKKLIAAIIVVLILAIGAPKAADYVKLKKSQDFVYTAMQELSADNLNLNLTGYSFKEKAGDQASISIMFTEQKAQQFIETLQAAPKESYVTADSVGLETSSQREYATVLLDFNDHTTYHFRCQDGFVQLLAWEQGVGYSFVIDDDNLSALVEEYNAFAKEIKELKDAVEQRKENDGRIMHSKEERAK